jgi:hypothetical protein
MTDPPSHTGRSGPPAFRRSEVEVLVPGGWVRGTLSIPSSQSLTDFLNSAGTFLKLADCRLPGETHPVGFFALQRDAIRFLAPVASPDQIETEGTGGITSPWRISCLFDQGRLDGRLDFLVNLRLSDYLRQQAGYLVIRDAVWKPGQAREDGRRWPVVVVNPGLLLGIVEGEEQPKGAHPGRLGTTPRPSSS